MEMASMGGMALGMGMPMGMSITNILDVMAGSLARRMFNRTPSCHAALKDTNVRFDRRGGEGVTSVKASGTCSLAGAGRCRLNSGAGVSGSGVVTYTVKPAAGKDRTGMITLVSGGAGAPLKGDNSLVVTQSQ